MQFIDLGKQYEILEPTIRKDLEKVLSHQKFINGPEVKELEQKLKDFVGVKHVITCANGTDALTIPMMALELTKEDAVFVPSFTFFASAEAISVAGGTPVFVDCDPRTFNMSPDNLLEAIEQTIQEGKLRPRGIITVDLFGQPVDYERISEIASRFQLFMIEDGAQSFGGSFHGKRTGAFGDVATTSFFPAKPLGCYGDGGAIFTNDDKLANLVNSIHVHGQGSDKYDNVRIGMNSRLDTMQAVVLLAKLSIFEEELNSRNKIAMEYSNRLDGLVETPYVPEGYISAWAQYTIKVHAEKREELIKSLASEGIPSMVYYPVPVHLSTAYMNNRTTRTTLPVSEDLSKTVMSLPMHPYLKQDEIEQICAVIREALK